MHPASHPCASETLCSSDWPQGFNIRAEYAEQQEMLQDTPLHAGAGERQDNHEELDAL